MVSKNEIVKVTDSIPSSSNYYHNEEFFKNRGRESAQRNTPNSNLLKISITQKIRICKTKSVRKSESNRKSAKISQKSWKSCIICDLILNPWKVKESRTNGTNQKPQNPINPRNLQNSRKNPEKIVKNPAKMLNLKSETNQWEDGRQQVLI